MPYELHSKEDFPEVQKFLNKIDQSKKFYQFKYEWKEMKYFLVGFYYQFMLGNLEKARIVYKKAIKRSECPKGAFNLLLSIIISENSDP